MNGSWFSEFFGTLDEALYALWQFGDPSGVGQGWWGLVILAIWGVFLIGGPLLVAHWAYGKHEWVSATMGVLGGLAIFWWAFGILPSAWIYYLDSNSEILSGTIIPASMGINGPITIGSWTILPDGYRLAIADNLYQVIRDLVVVILHVVGFVLTLWVAARIQKRYPKTLAEGEIKPESGGYK